MDVALIHFLQKLLLDTLSTNISYIEPPYTDISSIDIGLRKGLKNTDLLYEHLRKIIESIDYNCFYFYSDAYLLNYIFFHPFEDKDTLVVGPFLKKKVDKNFLNKLVEKHHLKYNEIESIRDLLHQIPVFADNIRLISILVDIIAYIRPGVSFSIATSEDVWAEKDELPYTPLDNYMLNAQATENRYKLEESLLQAVAKGNTTEALSTTRHFLSMLYEPRINDALFDKKAALYTTNTLLRMGAGRSSVHPIFLHELSSKYVKLIYTTNSTSTLCKLHEKMVHDYCLLVQNKTRDKYSTLIRNVLNYIDFNLSQPLTLSILAQYFHVSAPYLSKTFKKEVNATITTYITHQRIHESLHLISTTQMQIQEIAYYVGILDYNYYTKIFKKCIGCTPREYRKNLQESYP
jgi:two-component system response regulator YesN